MRPATIHSRKDNATTTMPTKMLLIPRLCAATSTEPTIHSATTAISDADHEAAAQFIEACNPSRVYGVTGQNTNVLDPNQTADLCSILKSLGLRTRGVRVVSCPSCARQGFDVIRTVEALEARLSHIKTPMSLSVLGCVVNGPGEARETDIGITGGGNGKHMVYLSGVTDHHISSEAMLDHVVALVEAKAAELESQQAA